MERKYYTGEQILDALSEVGIGAGDTSEVLSYLGRLPSVEPEIIRCKDCIHKPWYSHPDFDPIKNDGFDIIFPDSICPCQCEDGWYNWMPKDDFYCKRAERRTDDGRFNQ